MKDCHTARSLVAKARKLRRYWRWIFGGVGECAADALIVSQTFLELIALNGARRIAS